MHKNIQSVCTVQEIFDAKDEYAIVVANKTYGCFVFQRWNQDEGKQWHS